MKEKVLNIVKQAGMIDPFWASVALGWDDIHATTAEVREVLEQLKAEGKVEMLTHPNWTTPMWMTPDVASKVLAARVQNLNRFSA